MYKIDFYIPLFYNDGTKIEQNKLDKIKRELLREFKGLTINNENIGYWLADKEYKDIISIYSIITTEYNNDVKSWINGYKKWLEHNLEQKEIFITKQEIDII